MRYNTVRTKTTSIPIKTFIDADSGIGYLVDIIPITNVPLFGTYQTLFNEYRITSMTLTFSYITEEGTDGAQVQRFFIRPHSNPHVTIGELSVNYFQGAADWSDVTFTRDYRRFEITVRPYYTQTDPEGNLTKHREWALLTNDASADTIWYGVEMFAVNISAGQIITLDVQTTCQFRGNMLQV